MAQLQSLLKPQHPIINWGNPITQGLVFDVPLFEQAGNKATEIARNNLGTISNAPVWGKHQVGTDLVFADNNNLITFASKGPQNSVPKVTIEALVFPTGENAANDSRFIHKGDNTAKYFCCSLANTNRFEFAAGWQTTEGDWDTPAITLNQWYHLVWTYGFTNTSEIPICYLNGVSQTISTLLSPAGSAPTDTTTNLGIGNRVGGTTKGFVGNIAYVRYWNRILTQTEAKSLYVNPWQIYRKPNFNPFYVAAVGGIAYTKTFTDTITLTSSVAKTPKKVLSDSVTLTSSIIRTSKKVLTESVTLTSSIIRKTTKVLTESLTLTSTITTLKTQFRTLTDTITLTSSVIRKATKVLSDSMTLSSTLLRKPQKVLSDSVTLTSSIVRKTTKVFLDVATLISTVKKNITKIRSDTITFSENFAATRVRLKSVTDSLTFTETFSKKFVLVRNFTDKICFHEILWIKFARAATIWTKQIAHTASFNIANAAAAVWNKITNGASSWTKQNPTNATWKKRNECD